MSGEDLEYKPSVFEQAKFDYSLLGKIWGLKEEDKKVGPLKRLKNIEDKNKKQLDGIKYQEERQPNMVNEKRESLEKLCYWKID